jgi:hypothetical protein
MTEYRVHWLDDEGNISSSEWIEARSDDEVLALVRAKKHPMKCEIRDWDRLIATVPPQLGS